MTIVKNSLLNARNWRARTICVYQTFRRSYSAVKLSYAVYDTEKPSTPTAQPPVIIMHGLFGSKTNWNSLAKSINRGTARQVITVDARNHGDSPHSSEMTYPSMAEDVKDLLESLGAKKSILIGHSMGGAAMMCTALVYPDLVEKLLIVDMSPVKTSPSLYQMTDIINAMLSVTFGESKSLSEERKHVDKLLSEAIDAPGLRQFLLMNVVEVEPRKYAWRVNLHVIAQHFASHIAVFPSIIGSLKNKSFDGPSLFLGGSMSDYIKREDEAAIKTLFPAAEIQYIDGAGHWVQTDKPAEFIQATVNFINK